MSILNQLYYGNTVTQWLLALVFIVAAFVIGKFLYWVSSHGIKSLASQTQTKLDDLIIDMVEKPLVVMVVLVGFRYSLSTLTLSAAVNTWASGLFHFSIALLFAWLLLRLYEVIHHQYLATLVKKTDTDLDDQLLPIIRTGVRFIILSLGIIVGLNNAGYDVGTILAGLGIGGLAFALAAQDTVANIFGGIIVFIQRPFKTGDRISVVGQQGYVREIGLRSTLLETLSGEKVMLPNKYFSGEAVSNLDVADYYYQFDLFRLHRSTTLAQLEQLLPLLTNTVENNEHVLWAAAILAKVSDYSFDIQVDYGIICWQPGQPFAHYAHKMALIRSEIIMAVLKELELQNIKLALPITLFKENLPHTENGVFAGE